MKNEYIYQKLMPRYPIWLFRSVYVFIDTCESRGMTALSLAGVKAKFLFGYDLENTNYRIMCVSFPRKQEKDFLAAMDRHQKNAVLLGWGNTEEYNKLLMCIH